MEKKHKWKNENLFTNKIALAIFKQLTTLVPSYILTITNENAKSKP